MLKRFISKSISVYIVILVKKQQKSAREKAFLCAYNLNVIHRRLPPVESFFVLIICCFLFCLFTLFLMFRYLYTSTSKCIIAQKSLFFKFIRKYVRSACISYEYNRAVIFFLLRRKIRGRAYTRDFSRAGSGFEFFVVYKVPEQLRNTPLTLFTPPFSVIVRMYFETTLRMIARRANLLPKLAKRKTRG